jgi:hypothetical protein
MKGKMALFSSTQVNMMSRESHSCNDMPFAMPAMGAFASAFILLQTGVATTPVSSFVLALLNLILLVVLVVLISLLLTGLTGLSRWHGLVRQITKLATRYAQGD